MHCLIYDEIKPWSGGESEAIHPNKVKLRRPRQDVKSLSDIAETTTIKLHS